MKIVYFWNFLVIKYENIMKTRFFHFSDSTFLFNCFTNVAQQKKNQHYKISQLNFYVFIVFIIQLNVLEEIKFNVNLLTLRDFPILYTV